LARFAEKFTGYGMILKDVESNTELADKQLIKDKANFLQQYPIVSAERGKGYNYSKAQWNTTNVSGLEKRIALKLGISNYSRRDLGNKDTAGFHMVEHVMLRPRRTYQSQLSGRYLSKTPILGYAATENPNNMRVSLVPGNTFYLGEEIRIGSSPDFNATYTVIETGTDFIEINTPFKSDAKKGHVKRATDLRYFIRTSRVESFLEGRTNSTRTFCSAKDHNLQPGNLVEVTQAGRYDGKHEVVAVMDDGFEIGKTFDGNSHRGRWMPIEAPNDPYSLQLTFFFPDWIERYQNEDFKKFIALTIREETPAHMRVNIKWLDQNEMKGFDKKYKRFLETSNTL
jgi:hypothetical protein